MEKTTCNICGSPRVIKYKEIDHETGKAHEASHTVDCCGHIGVHPRLWNKCGGNSTGGVRSLGYSEYEHYYNLLAKERPSVPTKNEEGIEDIRIRKEKKFKARKPRKDYSQRDGEKRVFQVRRGKTSGVRGKSSQRRGR